MYDRDQSYEASIFTRLMLRSRRRSPNCSATSPKTVALPMVRTERRAVREATGKSGRERDGIAPWVRMVSHSGVRNKLKNG